MVGTLLAQDDSDIDSLRVPDIVEALSSSNQWTLRETIGPQQAFLLEQKTLHGTLPASCHCGHPQTKLVSPNF